MNNAISNITDYKFFSFLKIHYLLTLYFLACTFSIAVSEGVLFLIAVLWCYGLISKSQVFKYRKSGLELWLVIYAIISILAIVFSADFMVSISHVKHFAILVILLFGTQALTDGKRVQFYFTLCIAGGLINCFYALYKFELHTEGGLQRRLHGFVESWMTFSGFIMIIALLLLARIIWSLKPLQINVMKESNNHKNTRAQFYKVLGLSLALLCMIITLGLSMTRNSWIGLFFGIITLCFLHSKKVFITSLCLILVLGAISFPFLPDSIKSRVKSIFSTKDTTNRERMYMITIGINIIKKHPLLGIGPGTLSSQLQYYVSEGIDKNWNIPHLHNNILQTAADKGLLGLAAWLLLFLKWLYDSLAFYFKNRQLFPDLIAGSIAAVVAFLVSGLFEYNFGDSEILMLILFIMTIPYGVKAGK